MELKDKILARSFEMFLKRGIRSVSMDDIAQEMAISKKTIYKWYENKDAIVFAAIESYLKSTEEQCNSFAGKAANAIDELFQTMNMLRQMFAGIHPTVIFDIQKFHPKTWQLIQNNKSEFMLERIIDNLNRGIKEKLFRTDLDIEVISRLRLAQIDIVFNQEVFPAEKFDQQRAQLACLEHYMLGIATLKGHKLINKYKHITEEE